MTGRSGDAAKFEMSRPLHSEMFNTVVFKSILLNDRYFNLLNDKFDIDKRTKLDALWLLNKMEGCFFNTGDFPTSLELVPRFTAEIGYHVIVFYWETCGCL